MNDENDREAACLAFQENLGNRTVAEEALAERSFKAGWAAMPSLWRARNWRLSRLLSDHPYCPIPIPISRYHC